MNLRSVFSGDSLKARAARGSVLTGGNIFGQNLLRLISNLILTRLLFPEAFGLMALVQVILYGAAMFSDVGIRSLIVQNPRGHEPDFLNTAWTLQILRGFAIGAAIALLAAPLADFYNEPMLADLLLLAMLTPVIQGFTSTKASTADRNLMQGRLTLIQFGSRSFAIVMTVVLAWYFRSVWSLVVGAILGAVAYSVLSHLVLPGVRNRFCLKLDVAKQVFSFGRFIFLSTLATFFLNQGDRAVLGKFITLEDLAIYNIAFFLATAPVLLATALMEKIMFPLYARRPPSESDANRRKLNRARILLSAFLLTGTGCLALIGDPLIRLLYDPRYYASGLLLSLIALSRMPQMVTMSYDSLALAAGHSGRFATLNILRAGVQFLVLLWGVSAFGLGGAILAPPAAWLVSYPYQVHLARRYGGWDPRHDAVAIACIALIAAATLLVWPDAVGAVFTPGDATNNQ